MTKVIRDVDKNTSLFYEALRLLHYEANEPPKGWDFFSKEIEIIIDKDEIEFRFNGWSIYLNRNCMYRISIWETGA